LLILRIQIIFPEKFILHRQSCAGFILQLSVEYLIKDDKASDS